MWMQLAIYGADLYPGLPPLDMDKVFGRQPVEE